MPSCVVTTFALHRNVRDVSGRTRLKDISLPRGGGATRGSGVADGRRDGWRCGRTNSNVSSCLNLFTRPDPCARARWTIRRYARCEAYESLRDSESTTPSRRGIGALFPSGKAAARLAYTTCKWLGGEKRRSKESSAGRNQARPVTTPT